MPEQTGGRRLAHIVINPAARRVHRFDPGRALDLLEARGWEATIRVAEDQTHLRELAAQAVTAKADLLLVVGGDGALREAAGVAAGSETAVAAVPAGTANVWAREVGIDSHPGRAIAQHLSGARHQIDLGRADGEPFLLMASLGWDAEIVRSVGTASKRVLGEFAYVLRGLASLPSLRPLEVAWTSNGEQRRERIALLVVSNTRLYGGRVSFSPRARADDGLLEVCALSPERRGDGLRLAVLLLRGRLAGRRGVLTASARSVEVTTPGIPFQLDGDPAGRTPIRFTIEPGAVLMSLPAGPRPKILSRGSGYSPSNRASVPA